MLVNVALLLGLLAIAGGSLGGLLLQREHVKSSLKEYAALQLVESAEIRVVQAKAKLHEPGITPAAIAPELRLALQDLRKYKALLGMYDRLLPGEITAQQQLAAKEKTKLVTTNLAALVESIDPTRTSELHAPVDSALVSARADDLAADLASLLRTCNTFLNQTELASERDVRRTLLPVAILAGLIPLGAILLSIWQYRNIMRPLQSLRTWSRRIALGDFSEKYAPSGSPEFRDLGRDFNLMASELEAFYRQLEEMVSTKSRELVRSERLASVGYLAAGVAHEINSPLNIVSGYAELSVKRLRRVADQETISEILTWQEVIREEAFRCKQITGKLLSLARGGKEGREPVSLTHVASDVAIMVRGLRNFSGRTLRVAIDPSDPLNVIANETEMKQVMLNLTVNALEAVNSGTGEVIVDARRESGAVEITVSDNGRGMTRETIGQIFEPFYTDKRGVGEPGTGLGLSITHAIVADHGGRIWAESSGVGRGSRFTVRLPACSVERESHPARTISVETP